VSIVDAYNFRRIDDRCTTSGLVSAAQLGDLRRDGYEAVINLLPGGHDRAVTDEAEIVQAQGIDYVHIPVDFEAPSTADLQQFTEAMDRQAGKKVHIHCAANYRVSAFYSLYALQRGWWNHEEAKAFVAGVWDPAEFPVWQVFIEAHRPRPTDGAPRQG
jgi:uncharacterized protein (TIGR01244 family)